MVAGQCFRRRPRGRGAWCTTGVGSEVEVEIVGEKVDEKEKNQVEIEEVAVFCGKVGLAGPIPGRRMPHLP